MIGTQAIKRGGWASIALAFLLIAAPVAWAQDEPSTLAAGDAEDLMGTWDLKMDFSGTPIDMSAVFSEEDGNTIAVVTSAVQPGELRITDIKRDGDTLALKGAIEMGEGDQATSIVLTIDMEIDGDSCTGHVKDDAGLIDADISGSKAGAASGLASEDAEDWLGLWDLSMEFQGTPVSMALTLSDADGSVAGSLVSPTSPEAIEITDIQKTDDGIELKYPIEFGGQPVDLIMALVMADGAVSGTLGDTNGMFSADLTGEKSEGGAEGEAAASAEPFEVDADDASALDVADAKDYIGGWKLGLELRGNPVSMTLVLQDVEGKVGAYISSMFAPEPAVIEEIEMTDEGLKMLYLAKFGPQSLDINIIAKLEGDSLQGSFADAGGLISSDFTGERLSEDEVVASARSSRRRGSRGRGDTGEARIKVDGQEIKIAYATLKTDSEDYKTFQNAKAGDVFSFTRGRASKLLTEANLQFGDAVIKQGNAHESYPGVYSLWLKKTDSGWNLVANSHADIWGTQHEAEADVAEIPLTVAKADKEEEAFTIELVEGDKGGTLNIAWGDTAWSAKFSVQ